MDVLRTPNGRHRARRCGVNYDLLAHPAHDQPYDNDSGEATEASGHADLSFAAGSFALNASDKTQLQSLARKLKPGAKVTFTGYALSNPSLARNRALSTADFLYARVKVYWKVVSVSTHPLNRVTVTTTAL